MYKSMRASPRQHCKGLNYQVIGTSPTGEQKNDKCPATQVVQNTAKETCFFPAAPRGLRWNLHDWEEGDWERDRKEYPRALKGLSSC